MTERLVKIFSALPKCSVFADIGCDHGYIAKAMLDSGKCDRVIISDISAKCLLKAQSLLKKYELDGRVKSEVSDGFSKVDFCDLALIAGMGGEEISAILLGAKFLPENLVIQPMKNCDKARNTAVMKGYKIVSDFLFKSGGKFYDLIVMKKGEDCLTEEEKEFGRDNLKTPNPDFIEMLKLRMEKLKVYASQKGLSEKLKQEFLTEIERLKKYV